MISAIRLSGAPKKLQLTDLKKILIFRAISSDRTPPLFAGFKASTHTSTSRSSSSSPPSSHSSHGAANHILLTTSPTSSTLLDTENSCQRCSNVGTENIDAFVFTFCSVNKSESIATGSHDSSSSAVSFSDRQNSSAAIFFESSVCETGIANTQSQSQSSANTEQNLGTSQTQDLPRIVVTSENKNHQFAREIPQSRIDQQQHVFNKSSATIEGSICSTVEDISCVGVDSAELECEKFKIAKMNRTLNQSDHIQTEQMSESDLLHLSSKDILHSSSFNGEEINQQSSSSSSVKSGSDSSRAAMKEQQKPKKNSEADIIEFLELVGSLKHIKRTGWVMRNVKDCESISGHMYRMGMVTFLIDDQSELNRTRCMELALVHDLAESLVGDITPFCGISKEEKKLRELRAMEDICKLIGNCGKRMLELFIEYESGQTPESKFVKDLDRLDMVLQAFEYEKRDNCIMKHQEFFDSTDGKFDHPFVKKLVEEINSQRQSLAESGETPITNGYADHVVHANGHCTSDPVIHHTNGHSQNHCENVNGHSNIDQDQDQDDHQERDRDRDTDLNHCISEKKISTS